MQLLLVEDEPDLGIAIERTLITEKYVVDRVLDGDTDNADRRNYNPNNYKSVD